MISKQEYDSIKSLFPDVVINIKTEGEKQERVVLDIQAAKLQRHQQNLHLLTGVYKGKVYRNGECLSSPECRPNGKSKHNGRHH